MASRKDNLDVMSRPYPPYKEGNTVGQISGVRKTDVESGVQYSKWDIYRHPDRQLDQSVHWGIDQNDKNCKPIDGWNLDGWPLSDLILREYRPSCVDKFSYYDSGSDSGSDYGSYSGSDWSSDCHDRDLYNSSSDCRDRDLYDSSSDCHDRDFYEHVNRCFSFYGVENLEEIRNYIRYVKEECKYYGKIMLPVPEVFWKIREIEHTVVPFCPKLLEYSKLAGEDIICAKIALDRYNARMGTNLEFVAIDNVNLATTVHYMFYITLVAKDDTGLYSFQTLVNRPLTGKPFPSQYWVPQFTLIPKFTPPLIGFPYLCLGDDRSLIRVKNAAIISLAYFNDKKGHDLILEGVKMGYVLPSGLFIIFDARDPSTKEKFTCLAYVFVSFHFKVLAFSRKSNKQGKVEMEAVECICGDENEYENEVDGDVEDDGDIEDDGDDSPSNPRVFFNITIDGIEAGRIVMELYANVVPRTVKNFLNLCKGYGVGCSGNQLHYKGSTFHRVIPNFICQGGDFVAHNGTCGESIYGADFEDENFNMKHTRPGILSMANFGPNTNSSQFSICMKKAPQLDGKHVVFGRVIEGMDVLKAIGNVGSTFGKPKKNVVIADCGELI